MNNETLDKLIKSIESSNKKTVEEANRKQTEDTKEYINKEIAQLKTNFEKELEQKTKEYEAKYVDLKAKYDKLEKELRKNNIIIFGLDSPQENLTNFVVDKLNQLLEVKLDIGDINNAYTFGKQTHKKPIIVKLVSYLTKQNILKNCRKLKGTNISIGEELNLEERRENKILRQHLRKAREKNFNAVIKRRKLIINGQEYSAKQLAEEEEDTDDEKDLGEENIENNVITRKSNSVPTTPTVNSLTSKEAQEEDKKDKEVFETENDSDPNKNKRTYVHAPPVKIRSSARLFSASDKEKEKTPQSTKPKKIILS